MLPYASTVVVSGKAYNAKPFETKTGKNGMRFSLGYYQNKIKYYFNCVVFKETDELYNALEKGTPVTVYGNLTLDEWEGKINVGIFAEKVIISADYNYKSDEPGDWAKPVESEPEPEGEAESEDDLPF